MIAVRRNADSVQRVRIVSERPDDAQPIRVTYLVLHESTEGISFSGRREQRRIVVRIAGRVVDPVVESVTAPYVTACPRTPVANRLVLFTSKPIVSISRIACLQGVRTLDTRILIVRRWLRCEQYEPVRHGRPGHAVTYGGDRNPRPGRGSPNDDAPLLTPSGERCLRVSACRTRYVTRIGCASMGALRYDTYSLDGNGVSADGDHLLPKITVGVTPMGIEVYGTYAEAYRAPAIAKSSPDFAPVCCRLHPSVPNPNLRPETAMTSEAASTLVRFGAVGRCLPRKGRLFPYRCRRFHGDIRAHLTYKNIARAELEGVKLEATCIWGGGFATLRVRTVRREDPDNNEPLLTVPADRIASTACGSSTTV